MSPFEVYGEVCSELFYSLQKPFTSSRYVFQKRKILELNNARRAYAFTEIFSMAIKRNNIGSEPAKILTII